MEDNVIAALDVEILAEERLGEDQELMLYNMSLRQTSQRAAGGHEGTHVLVSRIENDPAYRQMIDRGLLECRLYGSGGSATAAATLMVTQKGLRYCVLFAGEIEPRRTYDVAGVRREHAGDAKRPSAGAGVDYAAITSGAASGISAAKEAAAGLTAEQVARYERIGAHRRGFEVEAANRAAASPASLSGDGHAADGEPTRFTITPDMTFTGFSVDDVTVGLTKEQADRVSEAGERRKGLGRRERALAFAHAEQTLEWADASGDVWSYVEAGEEFAQVVGVSGTIRSLRVPAQIAGKAVVSIAAGAFSMNDAVEDIVGNGHTGVKVMVHLGGLAVQRASA